MYMYVCMYVYLYVVRMYVCMHACMYACVCIEGVRLRALHIYIHARTYTYTRMCVCARTCPLYERLFQYTDVHEPVCKHYAILDNPAPCF